MNWVEKRATLEEAIPEYWNLLCIEFEQALESFNKRYGQTLHVMAVETRLGNCAHISYSSIGQAAPKRSIDICLDLPNFRIFSRIDGQEEESLSLDSGAGNTPAAFNSEGVELSGDRVSEFFLRGFLFFSP